MNDKTPANIKEKVAEALLDLKQFEPVITGMTNAIRIQFQQIAASQQGTFVNFRNQQGRFLSREVDRFRPCANSSSRPSPQPSQA